MIFPLKNIWGKHQNREKTCFFPKLTGIWETSVPRRIPQLYIVLNLSLPILRGTEVFHPKMSVNFGKIHRFSVIFGSKTDFGDPKVD